MSVIAKVLVAPRMIPNTKTTVYTVPTGVTTSLDFITATNTSASPANINVYLVTTPTSATSTNNMPKDVVLQAGESYAFPTIRGHWLASGDSLVAESNVNNVINFRVSGREST